MQNNFVSLDTLVADVLLEIGDESTRKYTMRARQWILDEYRRVNIHLSDVYAERRADVDENNCGQIPDDSVKMISVGIYRDGEYHPFVKKPNMSLMAEDLADGIYDKANTKKDTSDLKGVDKRMGYWMEDREHGRFFVRNYRILSSGEVQDTTSNIRERVVIRFRTSGLNVGGDIRIPLEARDYIVATVAYKFATKSIPVRLTNAALNSLARQKDKYEEDYTALIYEPASFYEVKDALFSR